MAQEKAVNATKPPTIDDKIDTAYNIANHLAAILGDIRYATELPNDIKRHLNIAYTETENALFRIIIVAQRDKKDAKEASNG